MKPRTAIEGGTVRAAWTGTLFAALLLACSGGGGPGISTGGPTDTSSSGSGNPGTASSSSSSGGGSDPTASSSGGVSNSSGGGTPGSSGSPSSSSGATGPNDAGQGTPNNVPPDAAPISASYVGDTKTLTSDNFTVQAGQEVYMCQTFANPFGADVDIIHLDGTMSQGSHHFFLFNLDTFAQFMTPAPGPITGCPSGGTEIHPFPYLSQQPHWITEYPREADGTPMGYRILQNNRLMLNVHFVNGSAGPLTAHVAIAITVAKPGVVKTHVGTLFLDDTNASISASAAKQTTTGSWPGNPGAMSSDGSYTIFQSWSHMHQWGKNFQASNGQTFYTEPNWAEPPVWWHLPGYSNPKDGATGSTTPVKMTANQALSWSCDWYNTTNGPLQFGASAVKNIMCIYAGQYYPANPAAPDVLYSTMAAGFPGH